jgi:hypothetical protein
MTPVRGTARKADRDEDAEGDLSSDIASAL